MNIIFGRDVEADVVPTPFNSSEWLYTIDNGIKLINSYVGNSPNVIAPNRPKMKMYSPSNSSIPFDNNQNITSVDLMRIPFYNNTMYQTFNNCQNLTSITNINSNITDMPLAFYNCRNLNSPITLPNNVTNLSGEVSSGMGYISYYGGTFYGCSNFNQPITIPNSVRNMSYTFYGCSNFNQPINIPEGVVNLQNTFKFCTNFNQPITIPSTATAVGGMLAYCNSFNSTITIPNGITSLGNYRSSYTGQSWVFGLCSDCFNFNTNINIPDSVTSVVGLFCNCTNFNQNIKLPNNVTNMAYTFYGCNNLTQNIQLPNSVTNMTYTFYGCIRLNQNIQIPNSVTNMYSTFDRCTNLNQNIQIPNNVTNMAYTFYGCNNLNQNIQIPNNVTNIGSMFSGCTNLNQNIQIPNSVTYMTYTFNGCTDLTGTINILSENITNVTNCFKGTTLSKNVYIPFTYQNGEYTKTYNTFNALYGSGQNGVTLLDLNSSAPVGCILYNTSIQMSDGTNKEAKDIKIGDEVRTYNTKTSEFEDGYVSYVKTENKDDVIKVTFEDSSYIELTSGHPLLTERGWASYDNTKTQKENLLEGEELTPLVVEDKVLTENGYLTVSSIEYEDLGEVEVYDIGVDSTHTFLCGEGNKFVLHNYAVTGAG